MKETVLIKVELRREPHLVAARRRAREIARLLGFDDQDQVRIATTVSEIARNALRYGGGGTVEFGLVHADGRDQLRIEVRDQGAGIPDLQAVLDGRLRSKTGMGMGLIGTRRLMDHFEVNTSPNGTRVCFRKTLPRPCPESLPRVAARVAGELAEDGMLDSTGEFTEQSRELLAAFAELHQRQVQLSDLNRELEETNRGVVALYAELDDRAREVQRIADTKSRFLSNITHEFRTPLNSILSLSRLLLERVDGELNSEQEKQIKFVHKAARDLVDLTNDLLDLAKVESGKIEVTRSFVDVSELFATLRGMLKPTLAPNGAVALVFEGAAELRELETDERKLSQILRNLVSNALKYTEKGEVRVSARRIPDGRVVFAVRDTGPGIAPENHERIFEEFFQVEGVHQQRVKGTGLGLPLARKFAELLGGRITLRSAPGKGSEFSFELPAPTSTARPDITRADVLVIDDEEPARYLLRRLLEGLYCSVREAAGGAEGLRAANERTPDLVILDLVMPDMGGLAVLRRLKENPATAAVPVLVHSSKTLDAADAAYVSKHAAGVASKGDADLRVLRESIIAALCRERAPTNPKASP